MEQDAPKDLKLLGIYESYSRETVKAFVKKLSSVSTVQVIYHDFSLDMTEALKDYFEDAVILVNRIPFIKTAWNIVEQSSAEHFQENAAFYREIEDRLDPPQRDAATSILRKFYLSSPIVKFSFASLIPPIESHKQIFSLIYKFKNQEIDISPITKIIEKLRKKTHILICWSSE